MMKEIAEALRDAAEYERIYGDQEPAPMNRPAHYRRMGRYLHLAARVEHMRCETCQRVEPAAVPYCDWFKKSVTNDFYCKAWKAKEVKNGGA